MIIIVNTLSDFHAINEHYCFNFQSEAAGPLTAFGLQLVTVKVPLNATRPLPSIRMSWTRFCRSWRSSGPTSAKTVPKMISGITSGPNMERARCSWKLLTPSSNTSRKASIY